MLRPVVLTPTPSYLIILPAGVVATLLMSAVIYAAPMVGLPLIDVPRLVGGIFSGHDTVAFWLGYWLMFLAGVFVFAPLLVASWTLLPGENLGLANAALKGLTWGGILWIAAGLLLPLGAAINQLPDVRNPGVLALGHGVTGALALLIAHVLFGLAAALIAGMEHGISVLDSIGWSGYARASTGPRLFGEHRSIEHPRDGATGGRHETLRHLDRRESTA
jgi:hypothetical protein